MSKRWEEMDDVDLRQLEAEMHEDLSNLRSAATVYAERTWARGAGLAVARSEARRGRLGWTAAGLTAVVALAVGSARLLQHTNDTGVTPGTTAVEVRGTSPRAIRRCWSRFIPIFPVVCPLPWNPWKQARTCAPHRVRRVRW